MSSLYFLQNFLLSTLCFLKISDCRHYVLYKISYCLHSFFYKTLSLHYFFIYKTGYCLQYVLFKISYYPNYVPHSLLSLVNLLIFHNTFYHGIVFTSCCPSSVFTQYVLSSLCPDYVYSTSFVYSGYGEKCPTSTAIIA